MGAYGRCVVWGGGEMCVISVGWCGSRIRPPLVEAARIRAKSMVFEKLSAFRPSMYDQEPTYLSFTPLVERGAVI